MYILQCYYEKIIKPDLLNKFKYTNIKDIPQLKKIVLNFGCSNQGIKNIAPALLSLELLTTKKGNLSKTKNANIFLKLKKGAPIGCYIILKKRLMYQFLFKLLIEIFPTLKDFKGIPFVIKKNKFNSFSFYIKDLMAFKEFSNHFYLFNNLPSLNITVNSNTTTESEFIYLLKSFKLPLLIKK